MEIYQYEYIPKDIVLTTDQNYPLKDGVINYIYIQHDYLSRRLPVIKIDIDMTSDLLASIYQNKDKAKLKLTIYERQKKHDGTVVGTKMYLQHTFSIIPLRDQTNYITSLDTTTEEAVDRMRYIQMFEAYLIDMDMVKWFTTRISNIFTECSKPAILHALFQMRNIPSKKLVATPPLDNTIIPTCIISMGDLIGNIELLNGQYGLYTSYPIIYSDIEYIYCVDKIKPNIVIPSATDYSNIQILIFNGDEPSRQVIGSCDDASTKTHFINIRTSPQINDYTDRSTATRFATIASIDKEGTVDRTTIGDDSTTLQYVWSENTFTVDQLINENMKGHTVGIYAENIGVSFLKPYKTVTFAPDTQFLDLKLTGHEYRIYGWSLSINRVGASEGAEYQHDVTMTLVRPTQDS